MALRNKAEADALAKADNARHRFYLDEQDAITPNADGLYTRDDVLRSMQAEANFHHAERDRLPVPLILHCPECRARHVDKGKFAEKVHHTHTCQACGFTWRPAVVPTVGVQFLPGFRDE